MSRDCYNGNYFRATSGVTSPSGHWACGVRFKWDGSGSSNIGGFNNSTSPWQELRLLTIQSSPSGRCYGVAEGTSYQASNFSSNGFVTAGHWCSVIMEHATDTDWIWYIHNTNSGSSDALTVTTDPGLTSYTEFNLGVNGEINSYANSDLADFFYITGLTTDLTTAEVNAYRKGFSPELIWPSYLTEFRRMIRSIEGPKKVFALTATGSPGITAHPPVIYPKRSSIFVPSVVAADIPPIAMAPPRGY